MLSHKKCCVSKNKLCTYFYSFCLLETSLLSMGVRARKNVLLASVPWWSRGQGFQFSSRLPRFDFQAGDKELFSVLLIADCLRSCPPLHSVYNSFIVLEIVYFLPIHPALLPASSYHFLVFLQ